MITKYLKKRKATFLRGSKKTELLKTILKDVSRAQSKLKMAYVAFMGMQKSFDELPKMKI